MELESILSKLDSWKAKWGQVEVNKKNIIDVTPYFANSKSRIFSEAAKSGNPIYALMIKGNEKPASGMFCSGEDELLVGRLLCDNHYESDRFASTSKPIVTLYQDTGTILFKRAEIPYARTHEEAHIKDMLAKNGCNPEKDVMVLFTGDKAKDEAMHFCNQVANIQKNGRVAYEIPNVGIMGIPQHDALDEESKLLCDYVHSQQPGFGTGKLPRDALVW